MNFVVLQLEYDTKLEREWGAMGPLVRSIEADTPARGRDDSVNYTENPLPPRVPPSESASENPFGESEDV